MGSRKKRIRGKTYRKEPGRKRQATEGFLTAVIKEHVTETVKKSG